MEEERRGGLLAWQWTHYPSGHRDRRNLVVHALTAPLFLAGTATAVLGAVWVPWWAIVAGLGAAGLAVALQGRGHRREKTPPLAIRGPLDLAARLFAEQWITFPRYVLSGGFARAWRESAPKPPTA
jgi:hypothetical protein